MKIYDKYIIVSNYNDDLICVKNENGLYGYIDNTGNEVIKCMYKKAGNFSRGLSPVQNSNGLWGYIDKSNNLVIDYLFEGTRAYEFDKILKIAKVKLNNLYGFIDEKGNIIIPNIFSSIEEFEYSNEYNEYFARVKYKNKYKYIDINGNIDIDKNRYLCNKYKLNLLKSKLKYLNTNNKNYYKIQEQINKLSLKHI